MYHKNKKKLQKPYSEIQKSLLKYRRKNQNFLQYDVLCGV